MTCPCSFVTVSLAVHDYAHRHPEPRIVSPRSIAGFPHVQHQDNAMPRALRPCATPGCPNLTSVGTIHSPEPMPPAARLWLARASLFTDDKGRTNYGPARLEADCRLPADATEAALRWLTSRGLVINDHTDAGVECWRLVHYDWTTDEEDTIGGYSRDAGQKRDGYPPMYGLTVDDVIDPPTGRQDFNPPPWTEVAAQIAADSTPDTQQETA